MVSVDISALVVAGRCSQTTNCVQSDAQLSTKHRRHVNNKDDCRQSQTRHGNIGTSWLFVDRLISACTMIE